MSDAVVRMPKVYKPLDEPRRFKVLYGGRSAARSWTFARKLLLRGTEKPLLILCTRELQKSIKDSVHRLLKNQIHLLGLEGFYRATESSIKGVNGTEFIFLGLRHNTEEIKSTEGVDIVWIEEGHALTETSWDLIEPTIRKAGSEVWISFNTRFKFDHVYQIFVENPFYGDDALVIKSSYRDNPFLTEVSQSSMQRMKDQDYEKYLHIWEGELKQLADGAIFGEAIRAVKKSGRLLNIPVLPGETVDTFWDVGKSDQTSIWFMQRVGMEYRFIDYYENRLEEIAHYVKVVHGQHPDVLGIDYIYGKHYMPHDVDHDRLGAVKNIKEQFEAGGIKPIEVVPRIPAKETAIQMGRNVMAQCYFHEAEVQVEATKGAITSKDQMKTRAGRMARGWEVLCNYRYRYKEDDDVYVQSPHHDWASNGADAYMQFAQSAPVVRVVQEQQSERRQKAARRNQPGGKVSHIV